MSSLQPIRNIVAAIVRQGDSVLLVKQQAEDDEAAAWALPGGRVEAGELLTEALAREVREETGLTLVRPGALLYVCQIDNPPSGKQWTMGDTAPGSQSIAFIFAVNEWTGEIACADPDCLVSEAEFVPLPEALARLTTLPPAMGVPTISYLRSEAAIGSVWCYRRQPDGQDLLESKVIVGGGDKMLARRLAWYNA